MNYKSQGYEFQALPDSTSSYIINWPIHVSITNILINTDDSQKGDYLNIVTGGNSIIGIITETHPIQSNIFKVDINVMQNLMVGHEVIINNYSLGICTSIDTGNFLITTEFLSPVEFEKESYVYSQAGVIKNLNLGYSCFKSNISGLNLEKLINTTVSYTNNSSNLKSFSINIEYLY